MTAGTRLGPGAAGLWPGLAGTALVVAACGGGSPASARRTSYQQFLAYSG
jgi:hypothetical protein